MLDKMFHGFMTKSSSKRLHINFHKRIERLRDSNSVLPQNQAPKQLCPSDKTKNLRMISLMPRSRIQGLSVHESVEIALTNQNMKRSLLSQDHGDAAAIQDADQITYPGLRGTETDGLRRRFLKAKGDQDMISLVDGDPGHFTRPRDILDLDEEFLDVF